MAVDQHIALLMVKTRLNRLQDDTSLDIYLSARIDAAEQEINAMQPIPLDESTADLLLCVDYTVWAYQNRDQAAGMPEWLRYRLRCRFLEKKGAASE